MESGVHTDLAAGAGKILVIGLVHDVNQGKWTNAPGQWDREIEALRASGSAVETIVPQTDLGDPMDAKGLPFGNQDGSCAGSQRCGADRPVLGALGRLLGYDLLATRLALGRKPPRLTGLPVTSANPCAMHLTSTSRSGTAASSIDRPIHAFLL